MVSKSCKNCKVHGKRMHRKNGKQWKWLRKHLSHGNIDNDNRKKPCTKKLLLSCFTFTEASSRHAFYLRAVFSIGFVQLQDLQNSPAFVTAFIISSLEILLSRVKFNREFFVVGLHLLLLYLRSFQNEIFQQSATTSCATHTFSTVNVSFILL